MNRLIICYVNSVAILLESYWENKRVAFFMPHSVVFCLLYFTFILILLIVLPSVTVSRDFEGSLANSGKSGKWTLKTVLCIYVYLYCFEANALITADVWKRRHSFDSYFLSFNKYCPDISTSDVHIWNITLDIRRPATSHNVTSHEINSYVFITCAP